MIDNKFKTGYTPTNKQDVGFKDVMHPFKYFKEKKYRDILKKDKVDSTTKKVLENVLGPSLLTKTIGLMFDKKISKTEKDKAKKELQELGVQFEKDQGTQLDQIEGILDKLYTKINEQESFISSLLGEQKSIKKGFERGIAKNIAISYKLLELVKSVPTPKISEEEVNKIESDNKETPKTLFRPIREDSDTTSTSPLLDNTYKTPLLFTNTYKQGETSSDNSAHKVDEYEKKLNEILDSISENTMDVVKKYLTNKLPNKENDIRDIIDQLVKKESKNEIEPDEQYKILKKALLDALKESGMDGDGDNMLGGVVSMLGSIMKRLGLGSLITKMGSGIANGTRTAIRATGDAGGKVLAKATSSSMLRTIPAVGAVVGGGFATNELLKSNTGSNKLSGPSSTVPGIDTAIPLGIDSAIDIKDHKKEMLKSEPTQLEKKKHQLMELNKTNSELKRDTNQHISSSNPTINNITNNNVVQSQPQTQPNLRYSNNENTFNKLVLQEIDHPSLQSVYGV